VLLVANVDNSVASIHFDFRIICDPLVIMF
jgi:hypothetical protein